MPAGVFTDDPNALTTPQQEGEPRLFIPFKEQPGSFGARITYWQNYADWRPLAALSTYNINGNVLYSVDESDLEDMGGGRVRWERVYVCKPFSWSQNVVVNKTYQWFIPVFDESKTPPPIVDSGIASWTKQITGVCTYDYYLGASGLPALPNAPFIQLIKYFTGQAVSDMGSGFPTANHNGTVYYNNNLAFSFVSATIEQYMGQIYVLKKISA